jgi:soluble lytic murein transglycosylase-like protein
MRFLGILLVWTAASATAGEYAVLTGGGRLHADRHEAAAGKVRLFTGEGYIELDALRIERFEDDGIAPKTDSAPAPAAPASAVATSGPAPSPAQLADAAADRYGLPRRLVRSLMSAESGGNPRAVSPKGAIGLMQLMPGTARDLGVNPADPAQNVDAGVRYLRDLLVLYDGHLRHALAAYNAGPGAVQKYNGNLPPYPETLRYIQRIERDYKAGEN